MSPVTFRSPISFASPFTIKLLVSPTSPTEKSTPNVADELYIENSEFPLEPGEFIDVTPSSPVYVPPSNSQAVN